MTKAALTLQKIELGGYPKIKSSLVVGIPATPCPSPETYPEWLHSINQAVYDLQDKGYFYRVSEQYSQLAQTVSDTCGSIQTEKDQVPWFGWSRIVLPVAKAGDESYAPAEWLDLEKMISGSNRAVSYLPSGHFCGRCLRLADVKRTLADTYKTLRQPYSDVLYLDLTPRREAGFLACAMWASVNHWYGLAKIITMAQDYSGPGLGVSAPQRELIRRLTPKRYRPDTVDDYNPSPPSYEGFSLDENGKMQDADFHGDCQPSDPDGFNRCMWEKLLKDGYPEEELTRLYGPRPAGIKRSRSS